MTSELDERFPQREADAARTGVRLEERGETFGGIFVTADRGQSTCPPDSRLDRVGFGLGLGGELSDRVLVSRLAELSRGVLRGVSRRFGLGILRARLGAAGEARQRAEEKGEHRRPRTR